MIQVIKETRRFGSDEWLPVPLEASEEEEWFSREEEGHSFRGGSVYTDSFFVYDTERPELWARAETLQDAMDYVEAQRDALPTYQTTYEQALRLREAFRGIPEFDAMSLDELRAYGDARREYEEDCFAAMTEAEEAGWDWEEE